MIKNSKTSIFQLIIAIMIVSYSVLIIYNSKEVSKGIVDSTYRCVNIIFPSLFAFMVLSEILVTSRLYSYISKPFYPITRYILKMPNELFFVFLLGNIAGYPIGVKLLSSLVSEKKITPKTASVMSCYCFAGGPAFYTGIIGLSIFGNAKIGLVVFLSILISNFIMAFILNRIFKIDFISEKNSPKFSTQDFLNSIEKAGKSMLSICFTIIFFSTFISMLDAFDIIEKLQLHFNFSDEICIFIKSTLELTSISQLSGLPFKFIPIITALCGFGGICVLLQIISVNNKMFSLKLFIITKPFTLALQFIISSLIYKYFWEEAIIVSTTNTKIIVDFNNFIPSVCLILMIFLLLLKKRLAIFKQM